MKVKVLKELLSHLSDDEDVFVAQDSHDYWHNIDVHELRRIEMETVVWHANNRCYRLLQEGQSVRDHENDSEPQPLHVLVLKS